MKFKLKITKDILRRSMPGCPKRCALVEGYKTLVPFVFVGAGSTEFYKGKDEYGTLQGMISQLRNTPEQMKFIVDFDDLEIIEETEIDVEIPDSVIEYHYGDTVKAVQTLINNPVLKLLYDTVDS